MELYINKIIKHRTAGYIARVLEIYPKDGAKLKILQACGEFGNHVPFDITAKKVTEYFVELDGKNITKNIEPPI